MINSCHPSPFSFYAWFKSASTCHVPTSNPLPTPESLKGIKIHQRQNRWIESRLVLFNLNLPSLQQSALLLRVNLNPCHVDLFRAVWKVQRRIRFRGRIYFGIRPNADGAYGERRTILPLGLECLRWVRPKRQRSQIGQWSRRNRAFRYRGLAPFPRGLRQVLGDGKRQLLQRVKVLKWS